MFLVISPHQQKQDPFVTSLAPMLTSSLEEVLVACTVPKALTAALDKAWTSPTERGRLLFNRPSEGKTFRPSSQSGEGLLSYLTGLVS